MSTRFNTLDSICNHERTATGVFLQVLFKDGHKEWVFLHVALAMDTRLTNAYLNKHPGLYHYHRSCWRRSG